MQRKSTLLVEYKQLRKSNAFIDRRFGEDDDSLTADERAILRFPKQRMREMAGSKFTLAESDAQEDQLTHLGQSLAELQGGGGGGVVRTIPAATLLALDSPTMTRCAHCVGFPSESYRPGALVTTTVMPGWTQSSPGSCTLAAGCLSASAPRPAPAAIEAAAAAARRTPRHGTAARRRSWLK